MEYSAFRLAVEAAAKEKGLERYELYYSRTRSQSLNAFKGQIDRFSLSESIGVCFRCLIEGKAGYASTEKMEEEEATRLVASAIESAQLVESTDPEFLVKQSVQFQPSLLSEETDTGEEISLLLETEKRALSMDSRIAKLGSCALLSGQEEKGIFNSNGVDLLDRNQYYCRYLSPIAEVEGRTYNGFGFEIAKQYDQMNTDKLLEEATRNTVEAIGAGRLATGQYPVVLHYGVATSFLETFCDVFSSEAAQKGLSLLKGKEGQEIGASILTIYDDPLCGQAVFHSHFDDEGVASQKKAVVEKGVLNTLLYNLKTAAKAGKESTGNAYKASYSSKVTVAPTNFYIQPGQQTLEQLFQQMGNGLYVTEMMGMHAGADSVTGDFSLEAKGFLVENGKKAAPVELFTIAGNFFSLLKDIQAVGNDLRFDMPSGAGQIGSPSLLVRSLSAAGE